GLWDAMYRVVMRRNGVYVTFVVAGAFAGERVTPPFPIPIFRSARPPALFDSAS
uniref:Complex III subunit 9 n=1 Tax=Aegilops tauschii subsp. strangulata TaxID=200361 RepID=A0A452Z2C0_AEGTS